MFTCNFPTMEHLKPLITKLVAATGLLVASGLPSFAKDPQLIALNAPEEFYILESGSGLLMVGLEAENLHEEMEGTIEFQVLGPEGDRLKVEQTHVMTTERALEGDLSMGFVVRDLLSIPFVRICAQTKMAKGRPCADVDLYRQGNPIEETPDDIAKERAAQLKLNPKLACRCTSGQIKISTSEKPDGSLGSFTKSAGGNKFGNHHAKNAATKLTTSTFKFQAHFEVAIDNGYMLNQPPPVVKSLGYNPRARHAVMCTEGQRINGTITRRVGKPDQVVSHSKLLDKKKKVKKQLPYKASTDVNEFVWDNHGYRRTGSAPPKDKAINGTLKAYEPGPALEQTATIHWLDAPGLHQVNEAYVLRNAPSHQDTYFHAFVHGSTGKAEDNCDCYFGIRSGVLNADGTPGASKILVKPVCK